jgi:hypothetical protein
MGHYHRDFVLVWWPAKEPFVPDGERIVERMNRVLATRDYTVDPFSEHKADLEKFFTVELGNLSKACQMMGS